MSLLCEVVVLFPVLKTKYPACSQLIQKLMWALCVLFCSWHPSIHVLLLPLVFHTHTGPSLKQVTFQPSCGGLQSCVLCCVWVWGPHIAHTPPAIHWPWAAPFMCMRPGVRGRRGGGEGCWPILFLSASQLATSVLKGHSREQSERNWGRLKNQVETMN